MGESVIEIVEAANVLPMKHQIGKLLFSTVAAFVASKVAERIYDGILEGLNARKLNG